MKVMIEVRDCLQKVAPTCTGTFERVPSQGRPPVTCPACQAQIKEAKAIRAAKPKPIVKVVSVQDLNRTCPCGNPFQVNPGRGRKATKCDSCRAAGTVYRTNDEGAIETIRAETLRREQEEKAIQAGKERAERLFGLMAPLLKATRERQVIVHSAIPAKKR